MRLNIQFSHLRLKSKLVTPSLSLLKFKDITNWFSEKCNKFKLHLAVSGFSLIVILLMLLAMFLGNTFVIYLVYRNLI